MDQEFIVNVGLDNGVDTSLQVGLLLNNKLI